ncbi:sulfatase-like hydrolase/transferase [Phytohabitans kaempferiae]|uniref:Sulfatase-like hydrolase/transferase n=1 Tax=Phytohabitans kaempferiae TaxID=1620943 RepID=A0ABV6M481_9ACTN
MGPNVLVVVTDQLRYDCLGHTSTLPVSTPNLDRLAAQGARFTHAFTHIPLCCPARQSFLTGRRPETFGGLWNYDIGLPVAALPPTEPTWPAALADRGYDSAYLGKWHVHPSEDPTAYGYREYVSLDEYEQVRAAAGLPGSLDCPWEGAVDPAPLPLARTHWFAERAASWLRDRAGPGPWHLRLDLVEPHLPCTPTREFADRYTGVEIPPWGNFGDTFDGKPYVQRQQLLNWDVADWPWDRWREVVRHYLAVISQLDAAVGILLAALRATGAEDDTLVVFTTDHGDLTGAHGMMDKHHVMYEEVLRVPLILRWPGRIAPGTVVDGFAYNLLDLVPTICAAAGVPPPPGSVGRDLLAGELAREHVVATYNGQQFGLHTQRMLRDRRWKYVWNATDVDELYDLDADPHELTNLARDPVHAETVARLRKALFDTLTEEGDTQMANDWVRAQLLHGRKW